MQKVGLFTPIKINTLELPNRIIMSPMFSNSATKDGFVTNNTIKHYVDRARSGVGLIMTEHTSVSSIYIHPGNRLQISRDEHVKGLKRLVDAVHQEDCKIGLQIAHSIYGAGLKPSDLTNEQCYEIIKDFVNGARRAKEVGFDAIELHYAHTYTMADFISRRTNTRTDEFGGDIYGRMFIHIEILKRIRELVGKDYPLFVRISAEEFIVGGNTLVQTRIFAKELEKYGIDCMDVSAGVRFDDGGLKGYSDQRGKPTIEYPDGPNVYLAEDIKKHISIPVITVGKLGNPVAAKSVIEEGRADMVALARPLIADSMWVRKVKENRYDLIKECLYCTECLYERHDPEAYIHCMRYTCQNACPANVEVPVYIDLASQRRYKEAYQVIQSENPLPLVCGRVCHHPCESLCNRVKIDEPMSIRGIKRYVTDAVLDEYSKLPLPEMEKPNGKKVAVIGSGPSGLSCAFFLQKKGYSVTVFEALPVIGGMLSVGLPAYRLPRNLLDKEFDVFREMGVKFVTNKRLGVDMSIEDLKGMGYEAVYIGVGTHGDRKLNIPGENAEGVLSGVEFLRKLNLGQTISFKDKKVAVIGGGNVAIDVARSALRLEAEKVMLFCLEKREEMPAHRWEIEDAEKEGVEINVSWGPKEISAKNNRAAAISFKKCLDVFDGEGRFNPSFDEYSTNTVEADYIIVSIGQAMERTFNEKENQKVELRGNYIKASFGGCTNIPYVFAGGDCVTGPDSVVRATSEGKYAAASIDKYLGGDGQVISVKKHKRELSRPVDENKAIRQPMENMACKGIKDFSEIEKGYEEESMLKETNRCLRCDVLKCSRL
ncbi:oxidoreductase [Lutispora sp.]|uniref:oxidoreductase n=1 Tax=Lutispora sp. TaxID=2828727 RepID=UPI002B21008D|nr:FAD-dependent oxidoreductase [Lutispora sp.]MEA4960802.1 FAD-dependent oxidoreductase [Lutispora sp.]